MNRLGEPFRELEAEVLDLDKQNMRKHVHKLVKLCETLAERVGELENESIKREMYQAEQSEL